LPKLNRFRCFCRLIKIISKRCHEPLLYIEPIYRVTRTYYREKKYRKRCYNYLDLALKERRELIAPINNNLADPPSTSNSYQMPDEEMGSICAENKHFIDQLILNNKQFSDEEIHDHIYTIVAAGYETTALQTSFTIMLLAMHQDVQEKLYNEITEAFPSIDTKFDCTSLKRLGYLEMVINESMRLLPPVPLIGRETIEDIQLNTVSVPKGVTLIINFFNLHRRKDVYGDDANEFNPDRFLPENVAKRHSHSFCPFSSGPRDCAGKSMASMAIRIILVKFLREYKVTTDLKYDSLSHKADITLKLCQELLINIERRFFNSKL